MIRSSIYSPNPLISSSLLDHLKGILVNLEITRMSHYLRICKCVGMFFFLGFFYLAESALTFSECLGLLVEFMVNPYGGENEDWVAMPYVSSMAFFSFFHLVPFPLLSFWLSPSLLNSSVCQPLLLLHLACFFSLCDFHQMSEIKNELDTLSMRAMLAAAFITYLSAAPEDRRRHCLETWMAQSGLPSKFSPINILSQQTRATICQLLLPKYMAKCPVSRYIWYRCIQSTYKPRLLNISAKLIIMKVWSIKVSS